MTEKVKWYQRKKFMIPAAIVLGIVGLAPLVSLIGVKVDDEFNPDYYKDANEPFFKGSDKK